MARCAGFRRGLRRHRPGRRVAGRDRSSGPAQGREAAFCRQHRVCQHHLARRRAGASRRPRDRTQDPLADPVERRRDRAAREQDLFRTRRAHRQLPIGGDAVRYRLHAFLACSDRHAWRRPCLLPRSLLARHLRARISRRALKRGAASQFPPGGRRQGDAFVSASLADAGFLAVSDRVDGPRAVDGDLSGALPQVSRFPRPGGYQAPQGLGLHGRRRDGRAGVARRHIAGRARASRQSGLCHQLQSAAARWSGAGKRQDHTGTRGRFSRRGLERHQGPVGIGLGSIAGQRRRPGFCGNAWKNASMENTRTTNRKTAPMSANISSGNIPS